MSESQPHCETPLAILAIALSAVPSGAQVPVVRPEQPTVVFQEPFTKIAGLIVLSGGRVLVGDAADERLVILGPAPTDAHEIGRVGSGPREFRSIGPLLPRAGGGAWVTDFVLKRLLPVTGEGGLEDVVAFPRAPRMVVRAGDARGRIYGEVLEPRTGRSVADSMPIVRWDPGTARVDTLTRYDAGWSRRIVPAGARRPAYLALETWVVLPAGEVAVLDAATYRVTVWDERRQVGSTTVEWEPVRVTQAERDAYYSALGRPRGLGSREGAPTTGPPADFTFPETLPAFDESGVRASPDARIWVERHGSARDSLRMYDVLDERGGLIARVALSHRAAIVGFGPAALYVAEANDVGEHFVARCAYPAAFPR